MVEHRPVAGAEAGREHSHLLRGARRHAGHCRLAQAHGWCRQSAAERLRGLGALENRAGRHHGFGAVFSSIMMTWVGVVPTFSPMWVCAGEYITSPALNSRISTLPSGRWILRLNGVTA